MSPTRSGSRNTVAKRGTLVGLALAAVWALFNWGDPMSWIVGVLFIGLGISAALWLPPGDNRPPRLAPIVRFAGFFLVESVRGGLQVARLALSPRFTARPGFYRHTQNLPCQAARTLFKDALTLTPGTIFVDEKGGTLIIHCLDLPQENADEIADLERRVGRIFARHDTAVMP